MSETLFLALAKSKTPEEFVEKFVLRGLNNRHLPSVRSHWATSKTKQAKLDAFLRSLGKGDYTHLIFVDATDKGRKASFTIGRTLLGDQEKIAKKSGQPLPHAKIFSAGTLFHVGVRDYQNAATKVGETTTPHSDGQTISRQILIPKKLLEHGIWAQRLIQDPKKEQICVMLEPGVFDKMEALSDADIFMRRYLNTVEFLAGEIDKNHYGKRLRIDYGRSDPYVQFHRITRKYSEFMAKLPDLKGKQELKEHIMSLGLSKLWANEYCKVLWAKFRDPANAQGFSKIARDAVNPINSISTRGL